MVYCFLLKLSQVKLFVYIVFIVLLVAVCVADTFPLDFGNRQSSTVCQKCNEEYDELTELIERRFVPVSDRHWCAACQQFLRCIEPLEYTCRTDLNFQGGRSVITAHMKRYNCDSMHLTWNETLDIIGGLKAQIKLNVEPEKKCRRPKFKPIYKICGLFGDPHLRTFDDKRHTCSVPGAWPLFANRHLTVQVTNIPLENGTRATATSKVTVIVRGLERKCIQQKTYQAKSFSLPAVFSDGTKSSDDEDCPTRVRQIRKGRVVQLDICPLKTKIIIRQVGKYLTVHMRVPKDLTRRRTIGLCQLGCPRIEQMNVDKVPRMNNIIASLYTKEKLSARVKRRRHKRARRLCRAAKVTGFYYKSCLFDLLTSNDASFARAARTAMKDFRKINVDELGRAIVNETAKDFYTGPTRGPDSSLRTPNRPMLLTPSLLTPPSTASRTRQTNLLVPFFTLVLLLKTIH